MKKEWTGINALLYTEMIQKQFLELVKILFHSKENVSKFIFFTASSIQKILFQKHAAAM